MRAATRGRPRALAAILLAAAVAVGGEARAQAPGDGTPEPPREGPLVDAPHQFRLGLGASAMAWEDAATRSPDDGALWGLDVERLLFSFVSARLTGAVGGGAVTSGSQTADVTTYVVEVLLEPRLPLAPLQEAGVVPFGTVGVGAVVHDPRPDPLVTRSQNAFAFGLGAEYLFLERLGVRAEWRRYSVDLEELFAELDRTGESREADRFQATLFWTF